MARTAASVLIGALALAIASPASAQPMTGEIDLFEYHFEGDDALLFDGALSYGGDDHALVSKLEVGGIVGRHVDEVIGQLLYSRAIGGGFNVEAGVRHEFRPHPHMTYATVGFAGDLGTGLAVESYAFLSEDGHVLGEMKAIYDFALVDKFTLQPRVGLNLAAQNIPAQGLGSGFTDAELGLRLRYKLLDNLEPYIGISHERLLGGTADIARNEAEKVGSTHVVVGISSSF
jgi:copper resistance protein B